MIHEITEIDQPNGEHEYVKRVYAKQIRTTRNVQFVSCAHPEFHPMTEQKDILIS